MREEERSITLPAIVILPRGTLGRDWRLIMRRGKREKMRSYGGYKYKSREELARGFATDTDRARTYATEQKVSAVRFMDERLCM